MRQRCHTSRALAPAGVPSFWRTKVAATSCMVATSGDNTFRDIEFDVERENSSRDWYDSQRRGVLNL